MQPAMRAVTSWALATVEKQSICRIRNNKIALQSKTDNRWTEHEDTLSASVTLTLTRWPQNWP